MKIVIDIPDEQIEKSLEESKYIHENEGEKGSVNIVLLYTNRKLEFVDISRKTDFYSLTDKYTVLPKGHGDLIDRSKISKAIPAEEDNCTGMGMTYDEMDAYNDGIDAMYSRIQNAPTIIEADGEE